MMRVAVKGKIKEWLVDRFRPYPYKHHQVENRYLFIHIPKNAGTAVLHALGDRESRRIHLPYYVYRNANKAHFQDFYKFSIVRNPWDRMVSIYSYLKQGGNGHADAHFRQTLEQIDFEAFVMDYMTPARMHCHSMFRPQHSFIFNEQDQLMVDDIYYQESLAEQYPQLCNKLGFGGVLTVRNQSERVAVEGYYQDPAVLERVAELYQKDVELLGYTMPTIK
ncbi:sulfotransferase family 2 domain-containing protein [Aliagarivorans taiwanensis]|uniref:sulfotransferase family 2 domain-containing protein n=1 Tax=Aliagarivorans taiwanensis TaxID=561966 RepID=UPI00047AA113|nr:sulfotransferase family 2 domain-containing protein [Aliagarivorans taiwanensis]